MRRPLRAEPFRVHSVRAAVDQVLMNSVFDVGRPVFHTKQVAGVCIILSEQEFGGFAVRTKTSTEPVLSKINMLADKSGIISLGDIGPDPAALMLAAPDP